MKKLLTAIVLSCFTATIYAQGNPWEGDFYPASPVFARNGLECTSTRRKLSDVTVNLRGATISDAQFDRTAWAHWTSASGYKTMQSRDNDTQFTTSIGANTIASYVFDVDWLWFAGRTSAARCGTICPELSLLSRGIAELNSC